MLVNAHRDSRRRRWWGEAPTEFVDRSSDDGLDAVDGADVMRRALDRLSAGQRQVVVLRYYAQLSERETAEALGVPNGTVKSRLARALDALAADPGLAALIGGGSVAAVVLHPPASSTMSAEEGAGQAADGAGGGAEDGSEPGADSGGDT